MTVRQTKESSKAKCAIAKLPNCGPLAHREEQGTFNPKVPGSRPGRPTKLLVRGLTFNFSDSNVANDVANALDESGESTGASYKIVRIASAALARERGMRCP